MKATGTLSRKLPWHRAAVSRGLTSSVVDYSGFLDRLEAEGIRGAYGFVADELFGLEAEANNAGREDGAVESEGSSPSAGNGYCVVSRVFLGIIFGLR
jgi:hypothetical protein